MKVDSPKELSHSRPILFYDGICKLCNWAVRFVLRHERSKTIMFSSLSSVWGKKLNDYFNGSVSKIPDSIVWLEKGKISVRSDAILKIIPHLKWYCKLLLITRVVPARLRNLLYQWVASRRYKWFGKYDSCPLPDQKTRERFIE